MIPEIIRKILIVVAGTILPAAARSQSSAIAPQESQQIQLRLTLDKAIYSAQNHSIAAMVAKYTFLSSYWSFRSYQASRLPSLNLSGEVLSFDRSLRLLQDYDTGEMRYLENYNLQNTLGLAIQQNITLTGGTLRLYSSLNRLDQFAPKESKSYYSQPITLSYTQPLFAYNSFKWNKKIAPKEYELAKRTYIEAMEDITVQAVSYYFSLLLSKTRHTIAVKNYGNTKSLYSIAEERLKLGSITNDELLQLQLRMLNDSLAINDTALAVREQRMRFNSYLRYSENVDIDPVLDEQIPAIEIDYVTVLDKALENSSFNAGNQLRALNAEAGIAQAKAEGRKLAMLTAYDYSTAKLEDEAGIDGISYAGKAEGMSYEAFMARDGIPAEFSSFAVTFTANGEVVKTITFAYGGSIDESQIPDCPTVEGNYGTWPEYDYSHLTFDLEVKAEYTAVSTVVAGDLYADNSRTPIVLAEGAFDPATDVHITSAEADGPTLRGNQKLYMKYNVEILNDTVEDDTDNTVSLRVYAPDTGASYTVYTYQNGTWASTSSSRDGSYLVFKTMDRDLQFAVVKAHHGPLFYILIVLIVLAVIVAVLRLLYCRKLKKAVAAGTMTEEEAALQLEMLGHSFFVFANCESGQVNVLYQRRDGDYGLIEPEFE